MQFKDLLEKKKFQKKQTITEIIFSLLHDAGVELNDKEKQTFTFYLEKCKENEKDKEAFEVVNTILKDKNEKTINVKGRIISELKKICPIDEKLVVPVENNIYTDTRVRHIPMFSASNRRKRGKIDRDGRLVIRKFDILNGSIVQYHRDLTYFDEKVLYALCTLSRQQKSRKVYFTLRQICKMLNTSSGVRDIKRIVESIRSLSDVRFNINRFLFKEGVSEQIDFSFIDNYRTITSEEKSRTAKSYVFLNEIIFEHITNSSYVKKMNKKYFELKNGYEFKIFSYLNILNKSKMTLNVETLLIHGLSIEKKDINDAKKVKKNLEKLNRALKNLKEKKYIKDFKIEGRGINRKYTFYL